MKTAKKMARITSWSTGHASWPPRQTDDGSKNVFVEGLRVHRVGDKWPVHCNSAGECHIGITVTGSKTVFCNGKQVARIGDDVDCSEKIKTGARTVYVGD